MTWEVSDMIALVAVGVAFASLILSLLHRRQVQHATTLEALQGDKEAVAYIAFEVSKAKIPKSKKRREEILESLCLAVIYQKSGRSRVMIYSALKEVSKKYNSDVKDAVNSIEERFDEFRGTTDLSTADKRLSELRSALGMPKKSANKKLHPTSYVGG
jgi:hypothetical protein